MEERVYFIRQKLKNEHGIQNHLTVQLESMSRQIEDLNQEVANLTSKLQETSNNLTKDVLLSISAIADPNPALQDLAEKFMAVLGQRETSYRAFQAMLQQFSPVKNLMNPLQSQPLPTDKLNILLPVWKRKQPLLSQLKKYGKPPLLVLEWMSLTVDFTLKNDLLNSKSKKLVEIERKLKDKVETVNELETELQKYAEIEEASESEQEFHTSLPSIQSTSTANHNRVRVSTHLQTGTASGGIMQPLYVFASSEHVAEEHPVEIKYEQQRKGCCGVGFFCF